MPHFRVVSANRSRRVLLKEFDLPNLIESAREKLTLSKEQKYQVLQLFKKYKLFIRSGKTCK